MVHRILKFRRPVPERTSPVTERNAAVHASGCLEFAVARVKCLFHFSEISYPVVYWTVAGFLPGHRQKCSRVSHKSSAPNSNSLIISLDFGDFLLEFLHLLLCQDTLVFDRRYLDEFFHIAVPVIQHFSGKL